MLKLGNPQYGIHHLFGGSCHFYVLQPGWVDMWLLFALAMHCVYLATSHRRRSLDATSSLSSYMSLVIVHNFVSVVLLDVADAWFLTCGWLRDCYWVVG